MTLTEGFVKDEIFIDFGSEIMFGDDQCYLDYPCRFPTVGFQLMATNGLVQIADRILYSGSVSIDRLRAADLLGVVEIDKSLHGVLGHGADADVGVCAHLVEYVAEMAGDGAHEGHRK